MNTVILRKDGFHLRWWNSETREYEERPLADDGEWLFEWIEGLELDGKITLGDIFVILAKLDAGERALFSALAEAANISDFIEEAQKPAVRKSDIDYIEVYRYAEINWYKREGIPDFEDRVVSKGCCEGDPQAYGIGFTPVNELLHCEIRLSPTAHFYDNRNNYNEQGEFVWPPHDPPFDKQPDDPAYDPNEYPTVGGKPCECIRCNGERFTTCYELGEFMRAVFDDICFHGVPASRDERLDDLLRRKEEVESGKAKLVKLTFDENGEVQTEPCEPEKV